MELTDEEQLVIVEYLYNKGNESEDIQKELISICGTNALKYYTISKFILKLKYKPAIVKKERKDVEEKIVKFTISKHCRASIEFICAQTKMTYEKVAEIVENLKLTNAYTRWMPKTLDIENKLWRVQYCANMLIRHLSELDFLQKMIIMQEIWLPVFSVKKKSNIHYLSLSVKRGFSQFECKEKLGRIIFWDQEGVILDHSIPKGTNMQIQTGDYYEDVIKGLLSTIAKVRPKLTDKIILHHDIVTLNKIISTSKFLHDKVEGIKIPPESPDLFPGDFWFSHHLKVALEHKEYLSMSRVEFAIENWLKEIHLKRTFEYNYKILIKHWEQCLRNHGESLLNTRW